MVKNIYKNGIPLLTSIVLLLISIAITLITEYTLNYKHYLAIILLGISLFFYFQNKKMYAYVFGVTLALGMVNVINVFYLNYLFMILGTIPINLIFLCLLILFLVMNKKLLNDLFPEKKMTAVDLEKNEHQKMIQIRSYERKFQSKTVSELKMIAAEDSRYTEEARIASKKILQIKQELD